MKSQGFVATTELYSNKKWTTGALLPDAMQVHCLARINTTHAFLAGGQNSKEKYSAAAYMFSEKTGFVRQANMGTPRVYPGCAVAGDRVVVVSGKSTVC